MLCDACISPVVYDLCDDIIYIEYFCSVEKSCHSSVLQAAWDHDIDWRKPTVADLFGNVCHHHSEV